MKNHHQRETPPELYLEEESEGEFHLSQWIEVIQRRRWLLVATALVVLSFAIANYIMTPKAYQATAVIQIERRTPAIVSIEALLSSETILDAQSFLPTQYRLLSSRGLAERVVRRLRLAENPEFNPPRAALPEDDPAPRTVADDDVALAWHARRLLGGLTVNPVRNTRLVELSYRSHSPALAAQVANAFAEEYIDWGVEERTRSVGRASSFLASQIEALKREIEEKEVQLQAFDRGADIVRLESGSNVTLQRLAALNNDYTTAVSNRIDREAHYRQLMNSPKDVAADTLSGGLVGQLRAELLHMERDYANKLNTFRPEWPAMVELRGKIDSSRANLASLIDETVHKAQEEARSNYETALRREQALTAELSRLAEEMRELDSASVEYNNLRLEVTSRRMLLDDLMRKQTETGVASRMEGAASSAVTFVERALEPRSAFRPSLRRNLALGLLLGLGLGLGAVFLVEYMDRTFKTPDDVERVLGLPVLAVVPDVDRSTIAYGTYYGYGTGRPAPRQEKNSGKNSRVPGNSGPIPIELAPVTHPRLAVSEAYRSLRGKLLLSTPGGLKSVLVTSAVSEEGKSTTAVNLAVVLAQMGRDVLVVDGDLRKPRLHKIFGISNEVGLTSFLAGTAEPAAVFKRTEIPHLYVTTSGPQPPNPSELLASDRMQEFLELAGQRFDHLVLDSTPALPVIDAATLAVYVDGAVLCVSAHQVRREDSVSARNELVHAGTRILGVVLNRYREERGRYAKAYRRYQEGYLQP